MTAVALAFASRVRTAWTSKPHPAWAEFMRALPVGVVTTIIDFGLLILLTEHYHVHYLTAAAVGFIAGQIWAYLACVYWVFEKFSAKGHGTGFLTFILLSGTGLLVTEISLWVVTEHLNAHYLLSKTVVAAITSLIVFFARRRFLFS